MPTSSASVTQNHLANAILDLRPKIEWGKEYSFQAASLLSECLRQETLVTLGQQTQVADETALPQAKLTYPTLKEVVHFGVSLGHLNKRLQELDLDFLQTKIRHERNDLFDYLGAHTLYDRYLLHREGQRYENYQHFWMRVAMGVSLAEADAAAATQAAVGFYDCISQLFYVPSTPTLFNAGTQRSQMSSCFLTTVQDDLVDIYRQYADNAMLSKYAGGLGNDWTQIRASGSWIKGTNGRSQGVIPFLKVQDSSTIAVNQGGKRKGAVCAYLETWHLDIEDFLELRKNTGDDRRRTHDMHLANWIPDLFLERVEKNENWTLFCPSEAPDLHEIYGEAFRKRYEEYEAKAARGELKNTKTLSAVTLWRKMLTMVFETGHPWMTFKDPCNVRSPQRHVGVVHSSNLCTEITLNTSATETAVCNIGSLNLKRIFETETPAQTLAETVQAAMRILDNVITENFYPIPSAREANTRHRPVGLGLMGFQDVLYKKRIPYGHEAAVVVSAQIMEHISYHAVKASTALAQERGSYATFKGSSWSRGELIQDTCEFLGRHVSIPAVPDAVTFNDKTISARDFLGAEGFGVPLNWSALRQEVAKGMRNSLCLAIAPTATISNIAGCCQSIEPQYKNLYVKSNMGGDYTIINEYLVEDLRARGLWNPQMAKELKRADGDISAIPEIPADLKELYQTAFDISPEHLIRCAAVRQVYIDQSQSLNLYLPTPSGRRLDEMFRYAWHAGLKTTYYLRTKAATSVEKSSIKSVQATDASVAATVGQTGEAKMCSIQNPDCESCQ